MKNKNAFIGLDTLEVFKFFVRKNRNIKYVYARSYFYLPQRTNTNKEEKNIKISRGDFLKGKVLDNFINLQKHDWNVAIRSTVKYKNGSVYHFPMMDLAIKKSKKTYKKLLIE